MAEGNKKLEKLVEKLAVSVAKGFEKVHHDIKVFKLETNTHFHSIETDIKSFKNDTKEDFRKLNEKFDDLDDTVMNHDKRIETLEEKILR
jgi:hypothetical protein